MFALEDFTLCVSLVLSAAHHTCARRVVGRNLGASKKIDLAKVRRGPSRTKTERESLKQQGSPPTAIGLPYVRAERKEKERERREKHGKQGREDSIFVFFFFNLFIFKFCLFIYSVS